MALYPGAKIDLIQKGTPTRLERVDGYVAHTGVASGATLIRMAKDAGYGGNTWHFAMAHDGTVTQLVDTKYRANCQVDGNWRLISCEHADYGDGFPKWNLNDAGQVPAFTPAQVDAEIELVLWIIRTHDIPARLMESSKPSEKGYGWHKLGCDPYRVSGGEKWSTSTGKVCPGAKRIEQIRNVIFPEVLRRLEPPTPAPPPSRKAPDMILYAVRRDDGTIGSSARVFAGPSPSVDAKIDGKDRDEFAKAMAEPGYVALLTKPLVELLQKAGQ